MLRKLLPVFALFVSVAILPEGHCADTLRVEEVVADYSHLTPGQVMERANEHYDKGELTEALAGYNLLINIPVKSIDSLEVRRVIEAHNKAAIVNYQEGNYRHAYELLVRAISLSEETGETADLIKIHINIGNIYLRFKAYERARDYYSRALSMRQDSASMAVLYNNMGVVEVDAGVADSALYYLRKSMQISRRNDLTYLPSTLNAMASLHLRQGQHDSAYYYYRQALGESLRNNKKEEEAYNLSDLGNYFYETGRSDSAYHYIDLSSRVATENNLFPILIHNHLALYKIAKSKKEVDEALGHFERYADLRDSLYNAGHLDEINSIDRMHEISKIDKQMEQLAVEQQIKERTIKYQRIMQFVMLAGLLVVSVMFFINFFQKRKLDAAYKTLVDKNQALMEYNIPSPVKNKKGSSPLDATQEELLDRILAIMEDTAEICDPKFSISVLAGLAKSNHQYVSQVINSGLNKNFRSFLNGYRIREAQRLFSEPDSGKFTIESVALRVGFRSRSAFREAFTEVTGVNPTFYLHSLQDK